MIAWCLNGPYRCHAGMFRVLATMENEVFVSVPRCVHRHWCMNGLVSPLLRLPHKVGVMTLLPRGRDCLSSTRHIPAGQGALRVVGLHTTIPAWVPVLCPGWAPKMAWRGAGAAEGAVGTRWWPVRTGKSAAGYL